MTYQQSGEPPIPPLRPPVPLHTCQSRPSLLPNPAEPHGVSNIVPKDMPDQAPINNNRRIPSKYPHVLVPWVETMENSTIKLHAWGYLDGIRQILLMSA